MGRWLSVVLLALCSALASAASGQAEQAEHAELWGVFEISLPGPADGNPFIDVQLSARFSDGAQTVTVDGFYDGDGIYRVRFVPPRPGRWTWVSQSNRWPLTN